MNIERLYKLYRLGIDIDPKYKKGFPLLEKTFKKLVPIKLLRHPNSTYYFNSKNMCMFERTFYNEIFVRYHEVWYVMEYEFDLEYSDIEKIFKFWIKKKFDLPRISRMDFELGYVTTSIEEEYLFNKNNEHHKGI